MLSAQQKTIFGDVAHGVPSPLREHEHPWPTRFHGPIYSYPFFTEPYQEGLYAGSPFAGPPALGACGACQPKVGAGLGAINLTGSATGNTLLDIGVGAGVGLLVGFGNKDDRYLWAGAGAAAAATLGMIGILGVVGAAFLMKKR
jgi:hypothetical protein